MSIMDLSTYIAEQIIIDEIMRSDMPQIQGKDYPEVLKIFKDYGVPYRLQVMNINDLFPMQQDFIPAKVDNIVKDMNAGKEMKPIFISSDYYIVDGHHRWLANKKLNNPTMKVIKVGYPKNAALKLFDKLDNKLNEGLSKITKTIVIYPGRFQPFHRGHYYSYNDLVSKFGKNNVYIATSNVTEGGKSPFSFKDKKEIITKLFGIPGTKVVQVKNPYRPEEILKDFDPKTTAVIVAVGEKDANRLGGNYYVKYKGKVEEGYLDKGYVYIVPQLQLKIQGKTISGTEVRNNFSKELFKGLYPKYDETIYTKMKQKLSESLITEGGAYGHLRHPFEDMDLTFGDMKQMITYALEGKLDLTQEKCISGDSIINLEKSGNITIKEAVDNKIEDKVFSYNDETDQFEFKNIIGYANNGQTDEWLEIELENGNKIKVTPNHRIYVKDIGYVQAKDLTEDMELIIK